MVICNKKSPKAKLWGTVGLITAGGGKIVAEENAGEGMTNQMFRYSLMAATYLSKA